MLKWIFILLIGLLVGCSTAPKNFSDLQGNFQENKSKLELRDSFAFYHGGHDYYFAQKELQEGKQKCIYIVGYKDGHLTYTFPSGRFQELESIYNKYSTPEERIALAVSRLDEFQKLQGQKSCYGPDKLTGDDIGYMIVFSPLLIFIGPMLYVKDLSNDVDDLMVNLDNIKLGLTYKETKALLNNRLFNVREDNGAKVYVFDKPNQRLVMYFKDNKLHAWVRGYKPEGDNFPTYRRQ